MTEGDKSSSISLRLSFDKSNMEDIDQWEKYLLEKKIAVTSKSTIGLDIKGSKDQLEEALNIIISLNGENFHIENSKLLKSHGAKYRPRIYSPRRPTLFN